MRRTAACLALIPAIASCESDYEPLGPDPEVDPIFNPADPPVVSHTDQYEQVQRPEVDVLWVIDNSCSMGDQQEKLAESAPLFMQFFLDSGLDYHIGVVSTDMFDENESGKLIPGPGNTLWITPETPDAVNVFAGMAVLGNQGRFPEKGLGATYAAFELQQTWNDGFFREDSGVHVIVLSDESDFTEDSIVTQGELIDYLNNLRSEADAVSFHSIVTPPDDFCPGIATPGTRYIEVTNAVGGVYWSLCDEWVGALEAIGLEATGLKREYFLSQIPVDGTIDVKVDAYGNILTFDELDPVTGLGDWTYNASRNSVTFLQYIPDPGAVVTIDYDVLASAERD